MGLEFLLLAGNMIFTSSLAFMVGIMMLEVVSMILGLGLDEMFEIDADVDVDFDIDADIDLDFDADFDADADLSIGAFSSLLDWIGFGRVPFLLLLTAFLAAFGLSGIVMQSILYNIIGAVLPSLVMSPLAFLASLPITSKLTGMVARIMPDIETTAISIKELVGREATIVIGTATIDRPAQAKVKDEHGRHHYVQVIPQLANESFTAGDSATLISLEDGVFKLSK